jgi:hypothetical protein
VKAAAVALAVLASGAVAGSAAAEPAVGEGVGTYTCAEYVRASAADASRELLYFSWAQGWMSGWNLAQMDQKKPAQDLASRPVDDQRSFLKTWCGLHPAELYMKAVYYLYVTFQPVQPTPK